MIDWMPDVLPASPALGAFGVVIWVLAALAFTVLAAVWVGRDAAQRELPAPWAFCLAAAFQPLVVLVVYLLVRDAFVPRPASREARAA